MYQMVWAQGGKGPPSHHSLKDEDTTEDHA